MTPQKIAPKVLSWASELEDEARLQAERSSRLPIVEGHIALMPDAHWGFGATVGSVIPTKGAVIPAAVGVDIGCGMIAVETDLTADQLPDDLTPLLSAVERVIPAGVGKGFDNEHYGNQPGQRWLTEHYPHDRPDKFTDKQERRICAQFGSLGSGNHFVEVCLDERGVVWCVLHSGSRGIGNELAKGHIDNAKGMMKKFHVALEDPDLAYLVEQTPEFDAYIADMLWCQRYALDNREQMMDALLRELFTYAGHGTEQARINCHHNFTEREHHEGRNVWLTRKGAIRAREGDLGVIPGSMGAASYIVEGKGNPASYMSCSHGAGRRMSRGRAKRELSASDLAVKMKGKTWLADRAQTLVDEHPDAYKSIDQVMADQGDLVEVRHVLHQILNFKGT